MDYLLFLLVNAILFLRPSEIIPDLAQFHIYETVILCCLACSLLSVVKQFSPQSLAARPITVCVLALWPLCGVSQAMRQDMALAWECIEDFFKVVVYFLLLVGIISTPARLRYFLWALGLFITVVTLIAVLRYNEVITITPPPAIAKTEDARGEKKKDDGTLGSVEETWRDPQTGQDQIIKRMRGTGIFNDPNDLSLILVTGVLLCLWGTSEIRLGPARFLCLAPMGLFLFALRLTHSRGGLLGLIGGLGVLFLCRFGWRRALVLGAPAMAALLAVLGGGRMTDIADASAGTGQARLQLWRDGMVMFKEQPLFGVGMNEYGKHAPQVAHNSFLQSYSELGIVGGTVFLGAFFCAGYGLWQIRRAQVLDADLRRMLPYLTAIVGAFSVGILSLSRNYEVATYTMLGLAAAYQSIAVVYPPWLKLRCSGPLFLQLGWLSLIFLLMTDLAVRFLAV
jgi:putative inorganic carbon (hco3(-)) transporter